jgi:hypothetical protein
MAIAPGPAVIAMLAHHDFDAAAMLNAPAMRAFHTLTIFLPLMARLFVILGGSQTASRQNRSRR